MGPLRVGAAAVLQGGQQHVYQHFQLARGARIIGQAQHRVAADLPQFRNGGQHLGAALGHAAGVENLLDVIAPAQQTRLIDAALLG